jgi:hypothetical protein
MASITASAVTGLEGAAADPTRMRLPYRMLPLAQKPLGDFREPVPRAISRLAA